MKDSEQGLGAEQLDEMYGEVLATFSFNYTQNGRKHREPLTLRRRVIDKMSYPNNVYWEDSIVSLVDRVGRRVIYNESIWHYENDHLVSIQSLELHNNASKRRETVANFNRLFELSHPYRVIPRAGAALVAHAIVATHCPVWYSSKDLSDGTQGSAYMYSTRLNQHFGNLVTSTPNGFGGFDVVPK